MNTNIHRSDIKLPSLSECATDAGLTFVLKGAFDSMLVKKKKKLPGIFVRLCFPYVWAHNVFSSRDKGA